MLVGCERTSRKHICRRQKWTGKGTMRFFRHVVAEYVCTRERVHQRSVFEACLSPFHIIVAAVAALCLWLLLVSSPWGYPWYHLFTILVGELGLLFAAGVLASLLLARSARGTSVCTKCGAPMILTGRHSDPAGSRALHSGDIAIFVLYIYMNCGVWLALLA